MVNIISQRKSIYLHLLQWKLFLDFTLDMKNSFEIRSIVVYKVQSSKIKISIISLDIDSKIMR